MLNDNIKSLITTTIALYNSERITQNIIEEGLLKLKEAVKLIKEQQEVKPIEPQPIEKITTPVTLEELESKFPVEPEYPELQLRDDYDLEVNLKADLLTLNVAEGTKVKTKGYYAVNDGGQAVYEIVSYDTWWNELPIELKLIHLCTNNLGNTFLYRNPGDNFGNHILKNGMIARLLPNLDGYVRVEQWGVFEGRKDNNRALMAVCAYNHQNAKILFGKNKRYELWYTPESSHWKNASGISTTGWNGTLFPRGVSEDSFGKMGNEYAICLHSRCTTKPVIGDAKNLELCGNNCEFYIPDEQFTIGGADFALIEMGGRVDGLKIHGFHLNGNHLGQLWQGKQGASYARTCNHGISYFSSGMNGNNGGVSPNGKMLDPNGVELPFTPDELKNYNGDPKITCFNNVEIYGNHFESLGTAGANDDCGGDAVLIINPIQSDNVSIHNNRVTNWGRWCFSIDLGGSGERFHNYTIKQNICIQDENDTYAIPFTNPRKRATSYRGLGFIDFEARKCFTNLDVSENYVYGMNCWAFNGNGKISENITIKRNNITRAPWKYRSGYPYQISFYSVASKDLDVRYNKFGGGSMLLGGLLTYNARIEENDFCQPPMRIVNPLGEIIYKNNRFTTDGSTWLLLADTVLPHIDDPNSDFYVPKEQQITNIIVEGNEGSGFRSNYLLAEDSYHRNTSLIFKKNKFNIMDCSIIGLREYVFDPSQIVENRPWEARGSKATTPINPIQGNTIVMGSQYYKEGQIVHDTLDKIGGNCAVSDYYKAFPDVMNYYTATKNNGERMVCTKEGVFPINGSFGSVDYCDRFFDSLKETDVTVGTYIYTLDNEYVVMQDGTLGTEPPTHTEGRQENGTAILAWVNPIARYEIKKQ